MKTFFRNEKKKQQETRLFLKVLLLIENYFLYFLNDWFNMEVDKPLFRAVSEEEEEDQEEPAPKRARFFPPDDAKLEEDKMEIEAEVEVEKESEVIMISSDEEEEVVPVVKPIIKTKNNVREWSNHYFGGKIEILKKDALFFIFL